MTSHIFVVATEWGGAKGGINVFNQSLVQALSRVVISGVGIHAIVGPGSKTPTIHADNLDFHQFDGTGEDVAKIVEKCLASSQSVDQCIVLGHDSTTGPQVIKATKALTGKSTPCSSAVLCHMDYNAYQHFKQKEPAEISDKRDSQRQLVSAADYAFAVGPLLAASFNKIRTELAKPPVKGIIPGYPELLLDDTTYNPSPSLKFFFSGRITKDDDPIKNGRLSLNAIDRAYSTQNNSTEERWKNVGRFVVYGFEVGNVDEAWFYEGVKREELAKRFSVELNNFTDQKSIFRELKDSHVALMPSIHEGFGLTGWEAICAGIPLICSDQSGLGRFLDGLFSSVHDLMSESVIQIRLGNTPGDVETLSDKIGEITKNFDRRKSHAKTLAMYLKDNYSWDECARELASEFKLAQSGPIDWRKRKHGGQYTDDQTAGISASQQIAISKAIELANNNSSLSEWSATCSALNILSDLGKRPTYAEVGEAKSSLESISKGIKREYETCVLTDSSLRATGRFDVLWRYLAAASHVQHTFKGFLESIPEGALSEILADSFLKRELLYYAARRYANDFEASAEDLASSFLNNVLEGASDDPSIQKRFARLDAIYPVLGRLVSLDPKQHKIFAEERNRCASIKALGLDVIDLFNAASDFGPTALALDSLKRGESVRGLDHFIGVWEEHTGKVPKVSWRGDKLLRAALLTVGIEPEKILEFIQALASDEDEAVRWAAIDLAFSPQIRKRLYFASRAGSLALSSEQLKVRLGGIIDLAVETNGYHPWMQREFLIRYLREHKEPVLSNKLQRFTLSDFPLARQLVGSELTEGSQWEFRKLHPEVEVVRGTLREHVKRILLVLPSITLKNEEQHTSKTSTPPLGMGMIGTKLLADGHDVYIADCHRDPVNTKIVFDRASEFDWIGFNVVLPTLRSTYSMAMKIKSNFNPPVIVVGGPAVNARCFRNAATNYVERQSWDFEIFGNAEENFAKLVADPTHLRTENIVGVSPNENSEVVLQSGHQLAPVSQSIEYSWPSTVILDRRLFTTTSGTYEPQKTRALESKTVEAHVVMSRGCDWNCTFCTERANLSGGEKRRPIDSIEYELSSLCSQFDDLRIQFIDDNLLPQIAAMPKKDKIDRARAIKWAETFLEITSKIAGQRPQKFGWRGIFRIEDFLEYENEISGFSKKLQQAGCTMLAFGIEHGNEEKRQRMKNSNSISNDDIHSLFAKLAKIGIHTKAYFIIGGPKESIGSSLETVKFAISCGASLAYFALYKEFVPGTTKLKNDQPKGASTHESYSKYEELKINWDRVFSEAINATDSLNHIQILKEIVDVTTLGITADEAVETYRDLSAMGFRFKDLVKYNDFHAHEGASSEILQKVNFGDQDAFERIIATAYMQFYLREEFASTYRSLIKNGY